MTVTSINSTDNTKATQTKTKKESKNQVDPFFACITNYFDSLFPGKTQN